MSRALRLGLLFLLLAAVVASWFLLPVRDWLKRYQEWTDGLGVWGLVLLGVAYVPASLLLVPGSILTYGAGLTYGVVPATIAVSLASTTAAAIAFLLGRTVARTWIERKISQYPRFHSLDRAIGVHGFKIVLLLRLSPLFPFTFLNYALGLTRVSFRDYLLASWIGMLPGTLLYVYLGAATRRAAEMSDTAAERDTMTEVIFWGSLVVTVLVTAWITRIAKKALAAASGNESQEPRPLGSGPDPPLPNGRGS